jgi:hypothetical protein
MGKILTVVLGLAVVLGVAWYATRAAEQTDPVEAATRSQTLERTRETAKKLERRLEQNAARANVTVEPRAPSVRSGTMQVETVAAE